KKKIELPGPKRFAHGEVNYRGRLRNGGTRLPSCGTPAYRRIGIKLRGDYNNEKVDNPERPERGRDAVMNYFPCSEGSHHSGSESVATNRNAGHQAATVRKPFDERCYRANVSHAHPDSCEDSIADVQPVERMRSGGDAENHVPKAVNKAGRGRDFAG